MRQESRNFMYRMILLILIAVAIAHFTSNAQTVTKNSNGNYTQTKRVKKDTVAILTDNTYTDTNGRVYTVYKSAKGREFIMKQKKDSTYYKMYMPK